jgi:heme-degrading monooxygenase HmoA
VIVFILNVDLDVKSGKEQNLESFFRTVFVPAISKQEGFSRTQLLRPHDSGAPYRLFIEFQNQALQQKWVSQPLHLEIWPQMEANFDKYSVHNYDSV